MAEVKKSISSMQVVGTLKEINLSKEGVQVREIGKVGNKKKVECNRISKTEFKNPAFIVEVNGNPVEIDVTFGVDEKYIDKDGNVADNPRYKALETILNTYVCGETRAKFDCSINANEYVAQDGQWKTLTPKVEFFSTTHNNVPEEDYAEGAVSGIVANRRPEIVNDNETGRLLVRIWSFDYKGSIYPVDLVVESDLASDFENLYETNSSVRLDVEVKTVQHGAKTATETTGFGRKAKRTSGYTTTEFQVIGGDEPFEEENEYYITADAVKDGMAEREVMIAKRIADKANAQSGGTTVKGSAANATFNPFGGDSNKGTSIPVESPF